MLKTCAAGWRRQKTAEEQVAELNIQGVSDVNRNDFTAAEQAFRKAYSLDPNNVFALNNVGYLSEIEGDRETAQFFYEKAQALGGANVDCRIGDTAFCGRHEAGSGCRG